MRGLPLTHRPVAWFARMQRTWLPAISKSVRRWIGWLVLVPVLLSANVGSSQPPPDDPPPQSDTEEEPSQPPQADGGSPRPLNLDAWTLPDVVQGGRRLRKIGLYASQLANLVPDDYRPVTVDRLRAALESAHAIAAAEANSRLSSAFYEVRLEGDTLVSERSTLEFESRSDVPVRHALGPINLAIGHSARDQTPALESDFGGKLVAAVRGNDSITFSWTLRGTGDGAEREFDLALPKSPQALIHLEVPAGVEVEAVDGVLRDPPEESLDSLAGLTEDRSVDQQADGTASGLVAMKLLSEAAADEASFVADVVGARTQIWIDVGGLDRVRLRTRVTNGKAFSGSLFVRRSTTQYDIDLSGVAWSTRMIVEVPGQSKLPEIVVSDGLLTSITAESLEIPFSTSVIDNRTQRVQLRPPPQLRQVFADRISLTVVGRSQWDELAAWFPLPTFSWSGVRVIETSASHQVQIRLWNPLSIIAWDLPDGWTQHVDSQLTEGSTTLRAQGPPVEGQPAGPWSQVRLVASPAVLAAESMLKVVIDRDSVRAIKRVKLKFEPNRIEPVRLRIQDGWTIRSLTFPNSDRVVESPGVAADGTITIWPEREDLAADSRLVFDVVGRPHRPGNRLFFEPIWLLRPEGVAGTMIAAVVPPTNLNWYGDATLHLDRIMVPELTPDERAFFGNLPSETLLFGRKSGHTPPLTLRPPNISYDVDTQLRLDRLDDWVTETLIIETQRHAAVLSELTVLTGPSEDRPEYRWVVGSRGGRGSGAGEQMGPPPVSLPSSKVSLRDASSDGAYTIDLSGQDLRGKRLVGRRRYRLFDELTLRLPSVPEAASQNATAIVGAGLSVAKMFPSVTRVPFRESRGESSTHLRYDAVDQPTIEVVRRDVDPRATMVWDEDVRVVSSSGGSDLIEARYTVASANPIVIDYPSDLELVHVLRGDQPLDGPSLAQRPLVLPGGDGLTAEPIQVVWHRNQDVTGQWRWCEVPEVRISGAVAHSVYRLAAATDTFSPSLLWRDSRIEAETGRGDSHWIAVRPGYRVMLLPRNVAIALGWVVALLVFALSWSVARANPLRVAVAIAFASALAILWLPWMVVLAGWVILPAVTGGLLACSSAAGRRENAVQPSRGGSTIMGEQGLPKRHLQRQDEEKLPVPWTSGCLWFLLAASSVVASTSLAQQPGPPVLGERTENRPKLESGPPIDLLIPVDGQGEPVGDKVYVPNSFFSDLLGSPATGEIEPARILMADYRVKLTGSREQSEGVPTMVEAEIQAVVDNRTTRVALPIEAASIRRVELLHSVADRIVRFSEDGSGDTIVSLPPGDRFRFRITLLPRVLTDGNVMDLYLDVPIVAASKLTVEGDRGIAHVEILGARGKVTSEPDLGRWSADLGPIEKLRLRYQLREKLAARAVKPLQRRFWVHVGKEQTIVDCEVTPPSSVVVGETIQLVLIDTEVPIMAGSSWRLERSEQLSPSRWLVTLGRHRESDEPIRLLWRRPTVINLDLNSDQQPASMSIPDVIAPASKPNDAAWVAIDRDPDLTLVRTGTQPVEPLSIDQFLDAWYGYHGPIDQSFVALKDLPALVVGHRKPAETTVRQRHHLHVTALHREIRFTAVIRRGDLGLDMRSLQVPDGVEILNVTVDGKAVPTQPLNGLHGRELPLGRLPFRETVTIEAFGVETFPPEANTPFGLPRLEILPRGPTSDVYTLTRDRSVKVTELEAPNAAPAKAIEFEGAEALTNGWIPVGTWVFEDESEPPQSLGGTFQVVRATVRFGCDQLISLTWDQGRWGMESRIKFNSDSIPDFIDLEIPTRWCDSLEVRPATTWARQPSMNPGYQVIRVQCDWQSIADGMIVLRGRLEDQGAGRVSVPSIRVLRARNPRVFVSVPNQLTHDQVRWRTNSVTAATLPASWREVSFSGAPRSSYRTTGANWSIELVSLPRVSVDAAVTLADIQLFPQARGPLALCRWDLVPGGLDQVTLRLPADAKLLGVWTAGQAVEVTPFEGQIVSSGDASMPPSARQLTVPLAVSRLSQPVELLLRLIPSDRYSKDQLPELLDIPIERRWLAVYDVRESPASSEQEEMLAGHHELFRQPQIRLRQMALAESVVAAVERSIDLLAEHPASEVGAWLEPWVARYVQLASADGHLVDWSGLPAPVSELSDSSGNGTESDAESAALADRVADDELDTVPVEGRLMLSTVESVQTPDPRSLWEELDLRMGVLAARFLADPDQLPTPMFESDLIRHYQLAGVMPLDSNAPAIEMPSFRGAAWDLRSLMFGLLSIGMVSATLILLWPLRKYVEPWLRHPGTWLVMMGIGGAFVAPLAVSTIAWVSSIFVVLFALSRRFPRRQRTA